MMTILKSEYIFPLYHTIIRDGLCDKIKQYDKNQRLSLKDLQKIQSKKIVNLLKYCNVNVPYYKNIFRYIDLTTESDFNYEKFIKIPFLTKKNIKNSFDTLLSNSIDRNEMVKNSTSGSTGDAITFFQDKNSTLARQAAVFRSLAAVSCHFADKKASLWGSSFDINATNSLRGRLHAWFSGNIFLSSYDLSDSSMKKYIDILHKFKPKVFISYAGPLHTFSRYIQKNKVKIPSIKVIITSGETLYEWQRKEIEAAFESPVFDRYGSREFGCIAYECLNREGYHVNSERFFLEVLDENGNPVKNGQAGELVVTDLDNYGFPFIRYRIGDRVVPSDKLCSCGRGLPMFERVSGRTLDVIKAPNGNRVGGTFWTLVMRFVTGVASFQVEQRALDYLLVRIVKTDTYRYASEQSIRNLICEKCGPDIRIEFEYVGNIPLTASGKKRFVISKI